MTKSLGKKDALSRVLSKTNVLPLLANARKRLRLPLLTTLTYHRVADIKGDEWFDKETVDVSVAQFDKQLEWVKTHFNCINTQDLLGFIKGQGSLPANPCLITFDDGYLDCLDHALPLLNKHGLQAVFFISTEYVDKRKVYWWDRVSYGLMHTQVPHFEMSIPHNARYECGEKTPQTKSKLLRLIKDTRHMDLNAFLDELFEKLEVPWDAALEQKLADQLVMTWAQVLEMKHAGMDMQSHTVTHRVLNTLKPEDLEHELKDSKFLLESNLNAEINTIAYPVGRAIKDSPEILETVRKSGYELGFTNASGHAHLSRSMHRFDIGRLAMDTRLTQARFEAMTTLPGL